MVQLTVAQLQLQLMEAWEVEGMHTNRQTIHQALLVLPTLAVVEEVVVAEVQVQAQRVAPASSSSATRRACSAGLALRRG